MIDKSRLKTIEDQLYRYNYWFCNEMMAEEENLKAFNKTCEEAKCTGVSGAPGNIECMKGCMEDTVKVINFLRNKEQQQYIEPWQLIGVESILNKCKEDGIVPFDLPGVLMAVLGMWNEIEKVFREV